MKKAILLFAVVLISAVSMAQSTKGFSFQGYARGADGAALQNEPNLEVKFTLYVDNETSPEFSEEQTLKTNEFGIFQAVIGVVETAKFDALDFASFDYTLKVEVKDNGNWQTVAKKMLLAVPYAKAAENSTSAITADKVKDGSNGVPVGTIVPFAGPTSKIPAGWKLCNGDYVYTSQYSDLYNAIGTSWGGSSSRFKLPDLRGVFLRGVDNSRGYDSNRTLGSFQDDAIESHKHSASSSTNGSHYHNITETDGSSSEGGDGKTSLLWDDQIQWHKTLYTNTAGSHSHTITVGYTGSSETRPKNAAVNYIIKY